MLKKLSVVLVCLTLAASLPARADDAAALGTFKQFMKCIAEKNDTGAWNLLNEISKSMIRTKIYADVHSSDPSVTEAQFDQIFKEKQPDLLAAFFGAFRKEVDFEQMLENGNIRCLDFKGQVVGLAVNGEAKWASVLVKENGSYKIDLDATMKMAK